MSVRVDLGGLASLVVGRERSDARPFIVAIVGSPGAGKTAAAHRLTGRLANVGLSSVVVGMDGFHLCDAALAALGRSDRKGAPDTFDADGLTTLLTRIVGGPTATVWAPAFDRHQEAAIAGSVPIEPGTDVVIVEGNYLLVNSGPWAEMRSLFDMSAYLQHADDQARVRALVARHVAHGRSIEAATEWVLRSDEANARVVERTLAYADVVVDMSFR